MAGKIFSPWDALNSPFLDSVILVVAGALISRFIFDPYFAYKKTIREIDSSLILYANAFSRSMQMTDETSRPITEHFRRLASDFSSNYRAIPLQRILIFLGLLLSQKQRQEVQNDLIILANTVGDKISPDIDPHKIMDKLRKILKIRT